jgi:hypothetical protein
MTGDCHVRFCENAKVKFLCVTRLSASGRTAASREYRAEKTLHLDNLGNTESMLKSKLKRHILCSMSEVTEPQPL